MTSITIYTNQKNYPYVYRLDNPITNEFYIGYRKANKVPAEHDLGTDYFTSAPAIKERFNEFQTTILAEFFDPNDAYDHEQYLIYCDLGNPKMINKSCYYGKQRFNNSIGKSHSTEIKAKISASLKGKPSSKKGNKISETHKAKISASLKGKHHSEEHKAKLSASQKGNPKSAETRVKISAAKKGKPTHNKGKPVSTETKAKISASLKGKSRGPFSAETITKRKESENNKPILICPHCSSSGKSGNWKRWHFDKCKLL